MYYIPYNKDLKAFARQLRNHSTKGEILLWLEIRAGTIMGYNFNRQKPIGRYIVDFYCKSLNLVIEVDGGYHFEETQIVKDTERQRMLEIHGLNFLRFHDEEVRKDMPDVIKSIENYIGEFKKARIHLISRK